MKNNKTALVSVGIPTYNRPDGLERTLKCITNQTYKNLEIVVSDNCSTDLHIQKLVKSIQEKDSRVHYFRQKENIGSFSNFKFVLEQSTGEYFMWAADDDTWEDFYVAKLIHEFEQLGATDIRSLFSMSLSMTNSL